ncbi:MAG: LacI family DNA-binding transcriptional regulator [Saprospiraceae bacterium]
MKKRQTTIKDIAKQLNIAVSTVSRALKGHPKISESTREKVMALAAKLNYKPNRIALNLKNQQTGTIGVIIPDIVHHFFATVISGIEEIAYANGYSVMFCQSKESYERELLDMKMLVENGVDGLMISHSRETTDFSHFQEAIDQNIPIVFFDRAPKLLNAPKVIINDFESARLATQHLIDQSCQNIIHLTGTMNLQISQERKRGFLSAITANLSVGTSQSGNRLTNDELVVDCISCSKESGYSHMKEILESEHIPDGVFVNNDMMAYGVMEAINEADLRIPEDIAVIGFSNWNFSSLIKPQLSSVDQQGLEMGRTAVKILLEMINDNIKEEKGTAVLEGKLVVRTSSKKIKQ